MENARASDDKAIMSVPSVNAVLGLMRSSKNPLGMANTIKVSCQAPRILPMAVWDIFKSASMKVINGARLVAVNPKAI